MAVGVGPGVGVGVGARVGVGFGPAVAVGVGAIVGVEVGVAVGIAVAVGKGVRVGADVGGGVGVGLAVGVGVGVEVGLAPVQATSSTKMIGVRASNGRRGTLTGCPNLVPGPTVSPTLGDFEADFTDRVWSAYRKPRHSPRTAGPTFSDNDLICVCP